MNRERWRQIDDLLQSALGRSPGERSAFLAQACADDEQLRSEMASLVASHEDTSNFFETPMSQIAADLFVNGRAALAPGQKIGPYKILSSLGAGGMGEVYLAEDTRLHRKVALKFLSTNFTQDHELLRRFEQEARAVSALNHPNILTIHEIGEVESHRFIATEFIEGQTLRERLRSNLEIDESLEIAIQVASALVAAHRVNIVHRDIKPENIMIRDDGLVKVLDFGLAKMTVPRASIDSGAQTQLRANTTPGVVMGTVAYMSPEQARGGSVDERTDIWSLGVVLYEMVAGCSPFAASTSNEMISAILSKESPPPLTRYSRLVPERLEEIVEKALTKNRDERYQTSKDLLIDLKRLKQSLEFKAGIERSAPSEKSGIASSRGDLNVGMHSESARLTPAIVLPQRRAGIRRAALVWLVACTLGLLLIVVGVITWQRTLRPASTNELEQRQLTANPSEIPLQAAAISPDGKYLVYSDLKGLRLQLIKDGQTQTLSVPEQFVASKVSWLPDGTGILADKQTGGSSSIWLLSILGGSPRKLRDDAAAPVASPDGSLVAFLGDLEADKAHGIWLMDINGENARRVLSAQSGEQFFRIRWSSEGQRLAYSQSVPGLPGVAVSQTVLGTEALESVSLNGEAPTAILTRAGLQDFYWLPDGRILFSVAQEDIFGSDSNLWTIRTDNQTGKPTGQPEQITNWAGFSFTDFSSTKDGKRLAFLKLTSQSDVDVGALEQNGTRLKTPWRLTLNERNDWPIEWTSDGRAVVFWSDRNGTWDIFKQRLDQETAEMIPAGTEPKWYAHFSPDGAWFLYMALPKKQVPGGSLPVKIMRVSASGGPPQVVLNASGTTDFRCAHAAAMLCVFDEVIGNQTVFTSFDPVKGREYEVFREKSRDTFGSAMFDLSPDGSRLAIAQFDPQEGRIRLVSLPDRTTSDLVVKGWNRFFEIDWAPDGRGLYVGSNVPEGGAVLYVDLQGQARLLWQQRGNIVTCGRPSPDGRFLAISSRTTNANAWIIENY